jgi:maleamate amidohydrolase
MSLRATALLCIDLQNEYRDTGAYPVEGYDAVLTQAAALIGAARDGEVPVLHVQAWLDEADRRRYTLLHDGLADSLQSGVAGSHGATLCCEVTPGQQETVIRKRWPSAFQDTILDTELRRLGIQHLLVAGVWTDSCVRASVFDAIHRGYRVWLVKDACGSSTETMHRAAVLDMANRLYGGGVMRTAEALKALRSQPYEAWHCTRPVAFPYTLSTLDALYETL